ncbi:hypothetical protein HON58_02575 [Candidatus Peregrinibacteria bacterium]|jgi:hypothetical protein|nr:hypothetical protein [Candidatus Peregrinibacteria bacterium]
MNKCKRCSQEYEVTEKDCEFYEKVSVPEPKLCPECRQQRRFAYRNEWGLHKAKCSNCSCDMISMFDPALEYNVYCPKCWWADDFNPLDYGADFDFERPFFEQFDELLKRCPLPNLVIGECENSDYANFAWKLKNCYLVTASDYSEDSMYSAYLIRSKDCLDCTFVNDCELCYQCLDTKKSYRCTFLQNCQDCSFCDFCFDCSGCESCLGCVNLRKKKYCIFNQEYSKEEYEKKRAEFFEGNRDLMKLREQFEDFKLKVPHKFASIVGCEDCTGDHLVNSKSCHNCFDMVECEDCNHCSLGVGAKDCMDCTGVTPCELGYESCATPENYFMKFCNVIWPKSSYLEYCFLSRSSNHCFGGVSLRKNEYCILNKQYTKEDYEELIPRIIEHMKKTGEYGEFYPIEICPFNYNEGLANDYYPLSREGIEKIGGKYAEQSVSEFKGEKYNGNYEDLDDVSGKVFVCEKSGKPYRIVEGELRFYKKMALPLPKRAPLQRHRDRVELRNPRKLWSRECGKCGVKVESSYNKDRPEKVYCEKCYLEEVY